MKILTGPREKLQKQGAKSLTDDDLIAIILSHGNEKHDVFTLAKKIVATLDEQKYDNIRLDTLQKIEGIGPAKAASIIAALEFARRRIKPDGIKITAAADVIPIVSHYADRKQEHFISISLNAANEIIKTRVVTVGLVDTTQVHPREVYADPITDRATSIIVCHNHPSGQLEPSNMDRQVTRKLKSAGEILGIKLVDHIIFNKNGYYSLLEHYKLD